MFESRLNVITEALHRQRKALSGLLEQRSQLLGSVYKMVGQLSD